MRYDLVKCHLSTNEEIWKIFPTSWHVDYLLCIQLCKLTRTQLEDIPENLTKKPDVATLLLVEYQKTRVVSINTDMKKLAEPQRIILTLRNLKSHPFNISLNMSARRRRHQKHLNPKPNLSGLEEFVNEHIVTEPTVKKPAVETSKAKASTYKPNVVRKNFSPPLIEDWISDSENEAESKSKIEKE
nr:vacuolar protein sorting-associated protein 53 A [Tanacetum cinerariifolium]